MWPAPDDPLGGFDVAMARPLEHESLYAARSHDIGGQTHIIGFGNIECDGFAVELMDPIPVRCDGERLVRK